MPYERVSSGQQFKTTPFYNSAFQNDSIDWVNAVKEGRDKSPSGDISSFFSSAIVKVRNDTGADRARGELVQLGAYLLDVVDPRRPWFEGNTLAAPAFKLALLRAPLKEDKIGEAQIVGGCVARVDVGDADHTHAIPVAGSHVLDSADFGPFVLLSPPDGTGEQDILVAFCDVDESRLDLTEDLAAGGDADGNYLEFTGGSWSSTGRSYTVYDSLGSLVVASGNRVFAQWDPRSLRLEAKQAEC